VFASSTGPTTTLLELERRAGTDEGQVARLFANSVMHAAAGHVSLNHGLRGGITSFTSGGLSSELAIDHAAAVIRRGDHDVVVVVCAEEVPEHSAARIADARARARCEHWSSPMFLSEAAVCFVVEAAGHAAQRGATPRAEHVGCGIVTVDGGATTDADALRRATGVALAGADPGGDVEVRSIPADFGDFLGAHGAVAAAGLIAGPHRGGVHLVGSRSLGGQLAVTAWDLPR
jgi:3-oxoacyl-[acyl-carrier-protein] synthase II